MLQPTSRRLLQAGTVVTIILTDVTLPDGTLPSELAASIGNKVASAFGATLLSSVVFTPNTGQCERQIEALSYKNIDTHLRPSLKLAQPRV